MSQHLDELRAAAEAEFAAMKANTTTTQTEDVPDDEPIPASVETPPASEDQALPVQAAEEAAVAAVEAAEKVDPPPARRTVYTRTVDLGDGSAPQVFKAATKDELIEKIFKAQENASKRIRELKEENKKLRNKVDPDPEQPEKKFEPRTLSQDEELDLINELQTNPTSALSKALKALIGADPSELREVVTDNRNNKQKESIREIGLQFINAHPEYPINAQNEKLMAEYIRTNKLGWTLKNLELAFADLEEAELITPASIEPVRVPADTTPLVETVEEVDDTPARPAAPAAQPERVVPAASTTTSVEVPRRKKTVVGISSSQSVATEEPENQREVSVEDLLKMPPDVRRRIVQRQAGR